jgi:hypothetical protein
MAKVLQLNHALRCRRCGGYGFVAVGVGYLDGEQLGHRQCPDCGGDGNNFATELLVRSRQMRKKKSSLSLEAFEQTIRTLIHGRMLSFQLGYNDFEHGYFDPYGYEGYDWHSDGEKEKALREQSVWQIQIYGRDAGEGIRLAASSLAALMQMVDQLEFQRPSDQR